MKVKNLFLGSLACLAFAACSNDDDAAVKDPGVQAEGNSYMAVNLTMANDLTRATEDGGYENGTEAESAVSLAKAAFYFYGADGAYITKGAVTQGTGEGEDSGSNGFLTLTNVSDTPNNVENESNALVVLGPTQTQPKYVIAVLNSDVNLENKSMTEVYSTLTDAAISTEKGAFVMTNTTYFDASDNKVYAQEIADGEICESKAAAIANPVDIYVERIVAKIKMDNNRTSGTGLEFELTTDETKEVLNNGTTTSSVQMKVVIDGWKINALNMKSYLIKNLSSNPNSIKNSYNLPAQFRSFWAEDYNYSGNSDNYDGPTYTDLKYYKWNEVVNKENNTYEYCYENTVDQSVVQAEGGDRANTPCMLIAAHTVYSTDGGTSYEDATDLFRYNGQLWLDAAYKNLYMQALKSAGLKWKYTDSEGQEVTADLQSSELTFEYVKVGTTSENKFKRVKLNVTAVTPSVEGATLYDNSDQQVEQANYVSRVNAIFDATDMASSEEGKGTEGYKEGKCYYQVPIEHLFSEKDTEIYGVVRNHIYNLSLTGVTKLGDAVYFPDEELEYIPGERKNYYVAAKLHILSWRVVNQQVEL